MSVVETIKPIAGCVVKAVMSAKFGYEKLFINLCWCDSVPAVNDQHVPLSLGLIRIGQQFLVVDVAMGKQTLDLCSDPTSGGLLNFVVRSVESKCGFEISSFKIIKSRYKSAGCDDKDPPTHRIKLPQSTDESVSVPKFEMRLVEEPRVCKISFPFVPRISAVKLLLSDERLEVHMPRMGTTDPFHIWFPRRMDPNSARAVYIKETLELVVTVPIGA